MVWWWCAGRKASAGAHEQTMLLRTRYGRPYTAPSLDAATLYPLLLLLLDGKIPESRVSRKLLKWRFYTDIVIRIDCAQCMLARYF
eukprot:COSAG05_NODE_4463_length_1504_cov_2.386477_2_plen_86_part_00